MSTMSFASSTHPTFLTTVECAGPVKNPLRQKSNFASNLKLIWGVQSHHKKYSSAKLSDVAVFELKAGLTWKDSAGREQSMSAKELSDWRGNRADAGRLAHGLPKSNKFGRGVD